MKKRSTKKEKDVKVVAVVTADGIQGSFQSEPRRPLIAHLQIKTAEVQFHDMPVQYDPRPPVQPEPYDASVDDVFNSAQELYEVEDAGAGAAVAVSKEETVANGQTVAETRRVEPFTKADLMVQFRDTRKTMMLPEKTNYNCFWCVHPFEGRPCVIPEREVAGVYTVYGNFCCPQCAVAFLLHETIDPHMRWERMALLHRIYDVEGRGRIFPAPSRETLAVFGGAFTIEAFRAMVRDGNLRVDVHMPPMVSILGSIDTKPIDFFDTSMRNTFVAQNMEKMKKAEEGLRLKRSKPLKDRESTLDMCMNIQIKNSRDVRVS